MCSSLCAHFRRPPDRDRPAACCSAQSGWNVFDFIVVAVGILLMAAGDALAGTPLSNLKMLRAFRVFRLFKRIKSLNKVVMSLLNAIPGVTNAFIIMVRDDERHLHDDYTTPHTILLPFLTQSLPTYRHTYC